VDIQDLKHEIATAEWARDYAGGIVEAVQVPLVVLGAGLRVLSANAAYYRLFREEAAQTEGRGFFELGGGEWDVPELRGALARVEAKSERFQALEVEREFPGAGRRALHVSGCAFPSPARTPMLLLAIDDVTERRQGERRRAELLALSEEAVQRAGRADAAKDLFLAALSHELRTPLTAILLHAQALQKGGVDPAAVVRAAATIEAATRCQARLVGDLLDVSRIVSGKIELAPEALDWRALVLSVLEAMRPEAEERSVQLTVACEGEPPVCVGDPERLQQVVANLLANAVKFTPGGGRVDVRVDAVDGRARLVVSDTGQGIAPEFLPHVFERFAQEPGSARRGGLGLGLALVHELVKLHGGSVVAESPGPRLGATFTVMLPRAVAAEQAAG